jgi:hypothetical protein
MDKAEALAQVKALREKWAEVTTIREKWLANGKFLCVAPADIRIPLTLLAVAVQEARTFEDAKEYGKKIEDILEWVWPKNTPQRFDVVKVGEHKVMVPGK